ncbi:MAG: hypothetical protein Q8Q51_11650 [Lutibacter sp.]|nr:hypothetical protein [Lutibacter sp.]
MLKKQFKTFSELLDFIRNGEFKYIIPDWSKKNYKHTIKNYTLIIQETFNEFYPLYDDGDYFLVDSEDGYEIISDAWFESDSNRLHF